jgi:hypothetical protein
MEAETIMVTVAQMAAVIDSRRENLVPVMMNVLLCTAIGQNSRTVR